jgi:diguanylate cyclase (GGDEF)-like protein
VYAAVSIVWILGSDELVDLLAGTKREVVFLSQLKGSAFVVAMGVLVGLLVYRLERRQEFVTQALRENRRDPVTGVPNRVVIEEVLDRHCEAMDSAGAFGILVVDILNLARVNHSLGRSAGDTVLRKLSRRMQRSVRPGDIVGRYDSDQFAVVTRQPTEDDELMGLARSVIAGSEDPMRIDGIEIKVDLHVGVAHAPVDGGSGSQLLDAAIRGVRDAKRSGSKNVPVYARDGMEQRGLLEIEGALRGAIRAGALVPFFQPQMNLATGRITAAEALVRWPRPDGSWVSPAEFIPVAESAGLVSDVTELMLWSVARQARDWRARGQRPIRLGVNLSGMDLRSDWLIGVLKDVLRDTGVESSQLLLEITESQFMEDPECAISVVHGIRELGIAVAIDDFGTGYSSLSYLTRFPVDCLKIDRAFVQGADREQQRRALLRGICGMGRSLGLDTVAEGVETLGQAAVIRRCGCTTMQGFLISPALPGGEFAQRFLGTSELRSVPSVWNALQRLSYVGQEGGAGESRLRWSP